jgi:uncharacterized protein (DUF2141 family)
MNNSGPNSILQKLNRQAAGVLLLAMLFLFSSCAQIVTPAGGPIDKIPPRAVKYMPDSAAIHFVGKTIIITFDEFIELTDIQKELTISPPMDIPPEVKEKGKMLLIELRDPPKQNTTYTLNFGNSIRDFTEKNVKTDFQYVFSTGDHIDTFKMSGTVRNAFEQKTEKGVLVMLYEFLEDSVPFKKAPSYFARTNADGSYRITHIRPGTYKVFALKEENGNFKYDAPSEEIAFSDTLVKIGKNIRLDMRLFKPEAKKQRLLRSFVRGYGCIVLAYAKPVDSIFYRPMNKATKTETFITEFNPRKDTVRVWFPGFGNDSLHFQVTADGNVVDTIKICTCLFEKAKSGRGEAFKLSMTANASAAQKFNISKGLELNFNHPVNTNLSKWKDVYLTSNSVKINSTSSKNLDAGKRLFVYQFPLVQDSSYTLFIPPGTFTDIFGSKSDTVKINFKTQEDKYFGTLKFNVKMKYRIKAIVQLMNEKGEIVNYLSSAAGVFTYTYLAPGSYKLRIIYDTNGDDYWTSGDYLKNKQPETVIYYPSPIIIRSNWDLELEWKVE